MRVQGSGGGYRLEERDSFAADWRRGVETGWINPMADHVTLQAVKERLTHSPWTTNPIPSWPDNVRMIRFPRSVADLRNTVDIYYEILEDDRVVWLERILPTNG
jgi:hypothetical protein